MPKIFQYKGRDKNGSSVTGQLQAETTEQVITTLKKAEITPLEINLATTSFLKMDLKKLIPKFILGPPKVEPTHLMNFFYQLGVLTNAGLPIIKAINKLSSSSTSTPLRTILNEIEHNLTAGLSLSDACKKYPSVFSPLATNIINVGENTGHLSETLQHLSKYIEKGITHKRRLISVLRYPILVVSTITIATIVMNYFVIPKFVNIFSRFNMELPLPTRIIMASSSFMLKYKTALIIIVLSLPIVIKALFKNYKVHLLWDKYKLRIPIFGDLLRRIVLAHFTWTFSLIVRAGVPIIQGLALASAATNNLHFGVQLLKMSTAIERGETLTHAAVASELFTPITIQMIELGEEGEKLDDALMNVSRYYEAEIEYDIKRLNELIEPIMLAIIGVMVLILAAGIYFPLWNLVKVAQV